MAERPKRCPHCGAAVVWWPKAENICQACVLDAIDRATKGKQGKRTDLVDNVNEVDRPTGNARDAALSGFR